MKLTELQELLKTAEEAYKKEATPENQIRVLEAKNKLLEAEKKAANLKKPAESKESEREIAKGIGDAIKTAMRTKDLGPQQPVKTLVDKLIDCDEVIVEKSEKDKKLVIVETLRKGVKISPKTLELMNRSILTQSRCKAYLPKGKEINSLIKTK